MISCNTGKKKMFKMSKWDLPFWCKNCWFDHSDNKITYTSGNENENAEYLQNINQEIMEKLVEMMEKFTQRIIQIENKI